MFFFKQKTAYELRISDWSSDVCSSDLAAERRDYVRAQQDVGVEAFAAQVEEAVFQADILGIFLFARDRHRQFDRRRLDRDVARAHFDRARGQVGIGRLDRKSVVAGRSVSVRVDLGGGRSLKKKKTNH